ncbi:uncharacterized protein [Musca autumnalis]|uniref:uncharacterized protein n=1 Tax=Musca autumnalis TaxID=221902 RepID=UPI003CE7B25B
MASSKLLLICAVVAIRSAPASADVLPSVSSIFQPKIEEHSNFAASKEGFSFNLRVSDGKEIGMIMNPGTPEEELVYDENMDDTITMATDDKDCDFLRIAH